MKKIKFFSLIILILVFSAFVFGCSKGRDEYITEYSKSSGGKNEFIYTEDRLIIYNVTISLYVDDLSEGLSKINSKLLEVEGYEQTVDTYDNDEAYIVLRIPTNKLNDFLVAMEGCGDVGNKNINSQDVTEQYTSCVQKLEALKTKLDSLKVLLENAIGQNDYDSALNITNEITSTSQEIDSLTDKANNYKKQADYSTLYINLYTVEQINEESFWEELGEILSDSTFGIGSIFGFILKMIVALLPYIILIIVIFAIVSVIRYVVYKKKGKAFALFGDKTKIEIRKKQKKLREIERQKQLDSINEALNK